VVFATADFMASYAVYDAQQNRYVLGPPLKTVSENTSATTSINPTFELAYWRFGLRTAQRWRERLGLPRDPAWEKVLAQLAPLPQRDWSAPKRRYNLKVRTRFILAKCQ
jgi:hypothetical protein